MITLTNIKFGYHYANATLFDDLSLEIAEGVSTILCDYQSGKSTLCKLIIGMEKPQNGTVAIDEININTLKDSEKSILFLTKEPVLFENKTVVQNVAYPLVVRGARKVDAMAKALEVLTSQNLQNIAETKVSKLTTTEKQSVAFCRGLVRNAEIVLLDSFCDNFETDEDNLKKLFPSAKHVVVFTSKPQKTFGKVYVIYNKELQTVTTPSEAQNIVSQLPWIDEGE